MNKAVVVDMGAYSYKAGISGNYDPSTLLRVDGPSLDAGANLSTIFTKLKVSPEDTAVLVVDGNLYNKASKEQITHTMFESFHSPAFYLANQAMLSPLATGKQTAVVVEIGEASSNIIPIYEGYPVLHAIQQLAVSGRDVTEYLTRILMERGYSFTHSMERDIVRDIKENHSYVSLEFENEIYNSLHSSEIERRYQLPDGNTIVIGNERFRSSEVLFQPSFLRREAAGLHQGIYNAIMMCDVHTRTAMYKNIILCGGTSKLSGLAQRVQGEVAALAPSSRKINTVAPASSYSAWLGGSILASLSPFQKMWITREEYDEYGPSVVLRKCALSTPLPRFTYIDLFPAAW